MITAVDARELQKVGIPQSEYLKNALDRTQAAIIDLARKGESKVHVALYFLTEDSFVEVIDDLMKRGFFCENCQWGQKVSKLDVCWTQREKDESPKAS